MSHKAEEKRLRFQKLFLPLSVLDYMQDLRVGLTLGLVFDFLEKIFLPVFGL